MIVDFLIPFAWGFAEATFFFIVPDVWLSGVAALDKTKDLIKAITSAVLGALLGGLCMYVAGRYYVLPTFAFWHVVPGIDVGQLNAACSDLSEKGLWAMTWGVFKGIPYKFYAAEWGLNHGGLLPFIAVSIIARTARFTVVSLIAKAFFTLVGKTSKLSDEGKIAVLAEIWLIIYVLYFNQFGWTW